MNKKERHKSDLLALFAIFPNNSAEEKIRNYISSNSSLPGRRANLELAKAFMEVVAELTSSLDVETLWGYCNRLTEITIEEGPVNTPREFLPFCGTCGLGTIGARHPKFLPEALHRLQTLATDSRWRMREAVRMALQQLLAGNTTTVQQVLEQWVEEDNWLVLRAVATSTGEQCLKMESDFALWALALHKKILNKIKASSERSSEQFKALRKGLAYTLSVVVQSIPIEGFSYLHQLAEEHDKDITWIVRQNLKKNRLTRNFPKEVKAVEKKL